MRSLLLGCVALFCALNYPGTAQTAQEDDKKASNDQDVEDNRKVFFPNMLPNNNTLLDQAMVDKVNRLGTKRTQVEFLVSLLPAKDAKEKRLTDDQLTAINLLGVSNSDDAVAPLIAMLEFRHKRSGTSAAHALGHLGKRSSEPLVAELGTKDGKHLNVVAIALEHVHGDKFPEFVEKLKQRNGLTLSPEASNMLRILVELSENPS